MARGPNFVAADDIRDATVDLQIEFQAPEGYWEADTEPPYFDPSQTYFWKGSVLPGLREDWREDWLEGLHWALRKRGWPIENIHAQYSYFDDPLQNPDESEEFDPDRTPAATFDVIFDGAWLIEHPNFLEDLDKLKKDGVVVKVKGEEKRFKMFYYRIYINNGELDGSEFDDTSFIVKTGRRVPIAYEGGPRDWFPELE